MNKQTPNAVLLVEPLNFGFNDESASYNRLQQKSDKPAEEIASLARKELLSVATILKAKNIKVVLVQDDEFQRTPSSVFPASWISFHENSHIVAYPLFATNRKAERRGEILNVIVDNNFPIYDIVDISSSENNGTFLHATESVVFDRINKVAYVAEAVYSNISEFEELTKKLGYFPITFKATINEENEFSSLATSQILSIAEQFAIVCLDAIKNTDEREFIKKVLLDGGKEIIEITPKQVLSFAGSGIQLASTEGKKYFLISEQAYQSLEKDQIEKLKSFNDILRVDISTIEQIGGASISSIVAGIFLPQ